MVVVLPAPLGPRKPKKPTARHGEGKAIHGRLVAVNLPQIAHSDGGTRTWGCGGFRHSTHGNLGLVTWPNKFATRPIRESWHFSQTQPGLHDKAIRALSQLPPFSPTLNKLLATLADEDVSFAALGSIVEKDTVLAGHVLKLVNSALYAHSGTVNSVRHAVSILGLNKLRNTALSLSVSRMWTAVKDTPRMVDGGVQSPFDSRQP